MPQLPISLSDYGLAALLPSPVSRMMSAFAADFRPGQDVNLGVGYVNEETLPRTAILEATQAVLDHPERFPRSLNYGEPQGSPRLVSALQRFLQRLDGARNGATDVPDGRRWVIGTGGATSLLEGLATVMKPGVVITTDPLYYIYTNLLRRCGFRLGSVPEDDDGIRLDALERVLSTHLDEVSFVYVVSIGNPSAVILGDERRQALVKLVELYSERRGRAIPLIVDTAYEFLVHGAEFPRRCSDFDRLGLVYELGTLSKLLAPALRIGYAVGPDTPLMTALVQRNSDVAFSASPLNQEVAAYLLNHAADEHHRVVNDGYRQKSIRTLAALKRELGDELQHVSGGEAGFYFYVTLRQTSTAEGSALWRYVTRETGDPALDGLGEARQRRVFYLPGSHCVDPTGALAEPATRQLRVSYGYASIEELEFGIELLGKGVRYARGH